MESSRLMRVPLQVPQDGPEAELTALKYLQSIYRNPLESTHVRMRAAAIALPHESPRLAVVGYIGEDGTFAERLDRALTRSGMAKPSPKLITHRPKPDND